MGGEEKSDDGDDFAKHEQEDDILS
ncbi:MAG: hypothetical protein ACJAT3_000074 [Akkermansiaceae bacterium]